MSNPVPLFRPGAVVAVVCGLWLALFAADQLVAGAAPLSRQDDVSGSGQEQERAGDAGESDGESRPPVSAAAGRRLDSRQLTLGGMFIGNIHLPNSRPMPNAAPTHEEMKAATTPPEFRTPPAISFGWSWRGRGR